MKKLMIVPAAAVALGLFLGTAAAYGQAAFKIPFKFKVGDKAFAPGIYLVARTEAGEISLRSRTGDEAVSIPVIEELPQPDPPVEPPQLVFDMVGNFEPSYTEYITEYLLAEVWLGGEEGSLVLDMERSEYHKSVKGEAAKK